VLVSSGLWGAEVLNDERVVVEPIGRLGPLAHEGGLAGGDVHHEDSVVGPTGFRGRPRSQRERSPSKRLRNPHTWQLAIKRGHDPEVRRKEDRCSKARCQEDEYAEDRRTKDCEQAPFALVKPRTARRRTARRARSRST
jgi:hypothetical protein